MAALTVLTSSLSAQNLGAAAAESGGDTFVNDGRVILYFKNTNATTRTITIVTAATILGSLSIGDVSVSIAQNEEKIVGPFPVRYFNNSSGQVSISYSGVTNLTVAAIQVL